jgi:hypothetical protein
MGRHKKYNTLEEKKLGKRLTTKLWTYNNPERYLWHAAKIRALKRNIEFTILDSDIYIPIVCPYLQIPIIFGGGRTPNSPSLDRINPKLGYTPTNIQVISDLANRMKQDATEEQLKQFANGVLTMYAK